MAPTAITTSSPQEETYESLLAKKKLQEVNSLFSTADYFLSELEEAVSTGGVQKLHEAYIKWLSAQKPDPSTGQVQSGAPGKAALHAARQGQAICLAYLLERDIMITACKELIYSVMARLVVEDEEVVRWFLAHGGNPNASAGVWDFTPLSCAVASAPLSIISLLSEYDDSVSRGQLVNHAAWRTDRESVPILQYMFDRGAPINNSQWEDREELRYSWAKSVYGTTPLYNAASQGNVEAVKWLLEHGADRHKRNLGGTESLPTKTALDAALEQKTPDH
ncbi:MAG: hypothetical protein Q9217_007030, partial [Psora testacea]